MQFTKLAIIAFLSGVGLAAPADAGLSKRARESIHMAHCNTYYAVDVRTQTYLPRHDNFF